MSSITYTAIRNNTVADEIYEGKIRDDDRVMLQSTEKWQTNTTDGFVYTDFPISATNRSSWDNFWNKYEFYVRVVDEDDQDDTTELDSNDFVYVDYIGPEGGKHVYACSPSRGLYELSTDEDNNLSANRIFTNGCCHINYHDAGNAGGDYIAMYVLCSDNRTSGDNANAIYLWLGPGNSVSVIHRAYNGTNLPFHLSTWGRLYYYNSAWHYGYMFGAYSYASNGQHNGYGCWYADVLYLENLKDNPTNTNKSSSIIKQLPAYQNTASVKDTSGDSTRLRYTPMDIVYHKFYYGQGNGSGAVSSYGSVCTWFVATGAATENGNNGNDVLIMEAVSISTTQTDADGETRPYIPTASDSNTTLYRFQIRDQTKQKIARILIATCDYKLYANNSNDYYVGGSSSGPSEIAIICCFDSNIDPYWMGGFVRPKNFKDISAYDSDYFPIAMFQKADGSGIVNNQWLACKEFANFSVLSPGGQRYLVKISKTVDEHYGWKTNEAIKYMWKLTLDGVYINHYLDYTISGTDVWICGHGGMIKCDGLYDLPFTQANETFPSTSIKEYRMKVDNHDVQMSSSTYDDDAGKIYAVGTYGTGSTGGAACVIDISGESGGGSSTIPSSKNRVITTCQLKKTASTMAPTNSINNLYVGIQNVLSAIKTNGAPGAANRSTTITGSSKTWGTAFDELIVCSDADIVDYLTGRRNNII